jgi:hypothetical protein
MTALRSAPDLTGSAARVEGATGALAAMSETRRPVPPSASPPGALPPLRSRFQGVVQNALPQLNKHGERPKFGEFATSIQQLIRAARLDPTEPDGGAPPRAGVPAPEPERPAVPRAELEPHLAVPSMAATLGRACQLLIMLTCCVLIGMLFFGSIESGHEEDENERDESFLAGLKQKYQMSDVDLDAIASRTGAKVPWNATQDQSWVRACMRSHPVSWALGLTLVRCLG